MPTKLSRSQAPRSRRSSVVSFYDAIGIEVLRLASEEYLKRKRRAPPASGERNGCAARRSKEIITRLPGSGGRANGSVHRRKMGIDALAGEMLAHALAFEGIAAASQPAASVNADYLAKLDLKGATLSASATLRRPSHPRPPRLPASAKTMAEYSHRSGAMERAAGTIDRRIP